MKFIDQICKSFSRQASVYESSALVQREIGERMFERLTYLAMQPTYILDLGSGTGYFSEKLKKRYPEAFIISLDISLPMLNQAQAKQSSLTRGGLVQADFMCLPFEDAVFDLIFANQVIHWANDYEVLFQEIHRVLKPEACFFFSTLGPDTFKELNQAWRDVDQFAHTNAFVDMHLIGDELLKQDFLDPVMDREDLCLHYPSVIQLLKSLKAQGVCNMNPQRNAGLTTPRVFEKFKQAYTSMLTPDGLVPLSYEVVQGHAWKGQVHTGKNGREMLFSIDRLLKTK
jgi:malonyl-CoA O-methyltransferase